MELLKIHFLIYGVLLNFGFAFSYDIVMSLTHNGPVVLGANVTFTAELSDSLNQKPTGKFAFEWQDNAYPRHYKHMMDISTTTVYWNVSYPQNKYSAGEYEVTVKAFMRNYIYVEVAHQEVKFQITEILNGKIVIEQDDVGDTGVFVSNTKPVKHTIRLSEPDHNFIVSHATSVLTFWFVDCTYYGFSTDFSFSFNYTEDKTYNVEALVVASFDEIPTTTTSTTTTTTTTPATTTTTSPKTNTTTITSTTPISTVASNLIPTTPSTIPIPTKSTSTTIPNNNTSMSNTSYSSTVSAPTSEVPTIHKALLSSFANDKSNFVVEETANTAIEGTQESVLKKFPHEGSVVLQKRHVEMSVSSYLNTTKDSTLLHNILPYACLNSTFVPPDPNKTYGYFQKQITAKAPITKVVVKGNNWLQFGDVLNLNISCNGSAKFKHCSKIKIGSHNVTGNETCSSPLEGDVCDFTLTHFFREANTYTYIIIIMNDVSRVVTPAVINMYKVTVQPQLSVIVVPVTCSLLAIIIIVFGVAYYVQSQNRYTVEVADFDFGQANDMEYKSFYERLREDLSNMFSRSGEFLDQVDVVPQRSKYDNMEES